MDKKNTMLLTVIAVATLLVAVVGATFAYFSVTGANDGNTTVVTTEAEEVGTVALTNPTATMHITLTAADMASAKQGTPYYATTDTTVGYKTAQEVQTVALATVTGGETDTKYKCTFNLNVVVDGTMKESLVAGDAKIVFSGALTEESDLTTVAASREVTFSNLTGSATTEDVKAYVVFNNTAVNQNAVAGKTLTVTLSNSDFACDTVE